MTSWQAFPPLPRGINVEHHLLQRAKREKLLRAQLVAIKLRLPDTEDFVRVYESARGRVEVARTTRHGDYYAPLPIAQFLDEL